MNKLGIQQDQENQPFLIYIGTWQLIGTSNNEYSQGEVSGEGVEWVVHHICKSVTIQQSSAFFQFAETPSAGSCSHLYTA